MAEDLQELNRLRTEGYCCASLLVQMGLYLRGEENPQLVQSVGALCGGLKSGLLCGALSGAACLLRLFPSECSDEMIEELVNWFQATYGEKYGGVNCADITASDPALRSQRCPELIKAVYQQAKNILEDYGCCSMEE